MNLTNRTAGIIFAILLLTGCSGNSFDRSLILKHTADNLILPAYEDFARNADSLHTKARLFTQTPNPQHLNELKNIWKTAVKSWKRAEIYNFGPVESLLLVTAIDRWPASESGIEQVIREYDGSNNYLIRIGSNRKGLPAIEYLLFHEEETLVVQEFSDPNRRAYLNLLTEALVKHSSAILNEWNSRYKNEFIHSTGNDADSGITLLANEMGYLLQKVRMEKLEVPFGKQTAGTPRLQMLESVHANISKELIRENLLSARRTFNGDDGNGFEEYLNALAIEDENGKLLSEAINREFENALRILDSIDGTMKNAILSQKLTVEKLIASVQKLYVYVDIEMISQLGILVVFSDNDGD